MRPDMQLDYAVFQLMPNRTRCELHIAAQGVTYKLASGLLKPFVAHLSAAEEQLAGGGYTIRLEPPDPGSATWFTKGTMERFVRFVSTPEVLERVGAVEMELIEIEETIRAQMSDASEESQTAGDQLPKSAHSTTSAGGSLVASANLEKPAKESLDGAEVGMEEIRKQQLSRFLDARRIMLQKEQGMAFARAIAAGFNMEQMGDLMLFADNFGAMRLREACSLFMASSKKRQESGLWQEDLKLAAVETAQADMMFNDSMAHYTSSREHLDLQGRGMKHDELRRASLPGDARLLVGDSGLEKLTRRGSLDELTGEFWQVAARMRAAGMIDGVAADWSSNRQMPRSGRNQPTNEEMHVMDGVAADWSSNRQMPRSGRNQPTNEEMHAGAGYVGSNSEIRDTESGHGLIRGHPIMPAWQGHPQNHFMHNIHTLPLHGPLHPPLGMSRPPQPGLPYPAYHGHPYIAQAYADANGWQMPLPISPPYWPAHLGYNGTAAPNANEHGDGFLQTVQNQGLESIPLNTNEGNADGPASAQRPASNELDRKDTQETVSTASTQRPSSDLLVSKDTQETVSTLILTPASDLLVSQDTQETVSTPILTPASDLLVSQNIQVTDGIKRKSPVSANQQDRGRNESPHDVSGEPHGEMTRRLPLRSSSPSRRSASPLRKVQIGRSGSKRSGIVNIRSMNYITQSTQDQTERENNDRESSGSWSEDNEESKSDDIVKPEPVRARVQDVIGLFESKKDSNESNVKSFTKENRRLPSQNSVLSRWTDSAALKRDANEPEESTAGNRSRRGVSDAFVQSAAGMESKQAIVSQKNEERVRKAEEDILQERDRQGASIPEDVHPSEKLAEQGQDENRKLVTTDDTIPVPACRSSSRAAESRMLNSDVELSGLVGSCSDHPASDDSFIVFERPIVGKEATNTRKMPLNVESEMTKFDGGNCNSGQIEEIFEPDNAVIVPDQIKDIGSRSTDMPTDSDMQVLSADMLDDTHVNQEHAGEEFSSRHDEHGREDREIGDKSKATNSKKVSERGAKARAMQEMLERRKAASGGRSGKPNPLAEAQLRAEKLRAYKAGLQKSKEEKEKEDKRRIEDLKSQRKERIAARSSPVEGAASQSPSSKQAARTPPVRVSRSSQTVISQKLSGSSPRNSINATASALSPNMSKIKAASANKLPRTSSGTPKANENALSCSAPSLSELKKESPKATLLVRSSTGSQRLSQLKKSLKDADPNSPPNANGHMEEKKRSLPLATVRKGIPPAKDIKGESLSVVKPTKGLKVVTKQQKKQIISPKGPKHLPPKERALETEEVSASVEQIDATNAAAVEALLEHDSEAGVDSQETSTDILENNVNNECSSLQDDNMTEHESGYAQIRAPASTELEVLGIADDSIHLPDESNLELASSDETLKLAEESKEEASNVASPSNADPLACSESEHAEAEGDINVGEAYDAPIAHMSPREDYSATCKEMDVNKDALNIPSNFPLAEEYNPPHALLSVSPLDTPSKNLPRLHEAIQQAHSPEFKPGVGGSKKKGGDSASQKPPKDHHAKGLKRLLLLGRKSHRSSTQNMTDWVSVSMTSEVDDDSENVPSSSGKSAGVGPTTMNVDDRADKLKSENSSGSSSGKGSRSFFSLSNFRGKSEGKS